MGGKQHCCSSPSPMVINVMKGITPFRFFFQMCTCKCNYWPTFFSTQESRRKINNWRIVVILALLALLPKKVQQQFERWNYTCQKREALESCWERKKMRISNAQCPLSKWRLFEEIRNVALLKKSKMCTYCVLRLFYFLINILVSISGQRRIWKKRLKF